MSIKSKIEYSSSSGAAAVPVHGHSSHWKGRTVEQTTEEGITKYVGILQALRFETSSDDTSEGSDAPWSPKSPLPSRPTSPFSSSLSPQKFPENSAQVIQWIHVLKDFPEGSQKNEVIKAIKEVLEFYEEKDVDIHH